MGGLGQERNHNMNNFVYAPRSLWLPEKKKLVKLIGCVQDEIHDRFTFSYNFIGSAERGLITYEPDGNKGFDFDVLNQLNVEEYILQGSYRSKSVTITDTGLEKAEELLSKYGISDWVKK